MILKANAEIVIDELTPKEDGTNPSSTKSADVSAKETRMRYIYPIIQSIHMGHLSKL